MTNLYSYIREFVKNIQNLSRRCENIEETASNIAVEKIKEVLEKIVEVNVETKVNLIRSSDRELHDIITHRQVGHSNPFVRYGLKCFSQSDEDGLTLEILNRLKIKEGTFAEFGVGNGVENNTLILLSLGWRGLWVGGQDLAFNDAKAQNRLRFEKTWVTKSNIFEIWKNNLKQISSHEQVDVISLDLDGNDFYVCQELLQHKVRPKLFIVEYNAKFPPPVEFTIGYNPEHVWCGDDYFGASLQTFYNLFSQNGYSLVCCNAATGTNAFFVQNEFMSLFPEVPEEIEKIYAPPFYFLFYNHGHPTSTKTVERILIK